MLFLSPRIMANDEPTAAEARHGWVTSLAFWLCLLAAAGLYAGVALSPRLLDFLTLRRDYHENQLQLVAVERQVGHLQKVIDALRHDPAFAREQARADFDVAAGNEQRIPVDGHLTLNIGTGKPDLSVIPPDLPWYAVLLQLIAHSRGLSNGMLVASGLLTVYAFAFLQEKRLSQE